MTKRIAFPGGKLCAVCAQPIVPYVNRQGTIVRYWTQDMRSELCRFCAEGKER